MQTHSFSLLLAGSPDLTDANLLDRLFEAGADDASFGEREGRAYAEFERQDGSLASAIVSAIEQVESVSPLRVVRVDEQDLVTMSDIATRTGRSRQNIWQLARGDRGAGDFPEPVAAIGEDRSLWRWSDVADWFARRGMDLEAAAERAHLVSAVNAALELRAHAEHLAEAGARTVIAHIALELVTSRHAVADTYGSRVGVYERITDTCTITSTTRVSTEAPKPRGADVATTRYEYAA